MSFNIQIFQSLPDKERFRLILQKLTELGVARICPFISDRSTSVEALDKKQKKSHRWPDIIINASKQCRRAVIPELTIPLSWEAVLKNIKDSDAIFILNEHENNNCLKNALKKLNSKKISLIVGPEGGFTNKEVEDVKNAGGQSISLGKRILRTETASIVAAGLIVYETGGFE